MRYGAMISHLDFQTLLVVVYFSIGSLAAAVLLCWVPAVSRQALTQPQPQPQQVHRPCFPCSIRALHAVVYFALWPVAVPWVIVHEKLKERRARLDAQLPRYEANPALDPAMAPPRPPSARAMVRSALPSGGSARSVSFSARVDRVTWETIPLNDVTPRRPLTPPPCYRETDPRRDNV